MRKPSLKHDSEASFLCAHLRQSLLEAQQLLAIKLGRVSLQKK